MESSDLSPQDFYQRLRETAESNIDSLVDFFLFEGVPYGLSDWSEYCRFRKELSGRLEVNSKSIVMVGSGRFGFSLSPRQKLWRAFGDRSDFDIVVVDHREFDSAWDEILKSDDEPNSPSNFRELRQRWRNLYDGFIDVNGLPDHIAFVKRWKSAFTEISAMRWKGQTRTTKGFLFRDWFHAQRFYRKSFRAILKGVDDHKLSKPE